MKKKLMIISIKKSLDQISADAANSKLITLMVVFYDESSNCLALIETLSGYC